MSKIYYELILINNMLIFFVFVMVVVGVFFIFCKRFNEFKIFYEIVFSGDYKFEKGFLWCKYRGL